MLNVLYTCFKGYLFRPPDKSVTENYGVQADQSLHLVHIVICWFCSIFIYAVLIFLVS